MCGVVFAYRPDLNQKDLAVLMDRAVARMMHRGPDGQGISGDFPWSMGHRRLAVIDPRGSFQPMSDPGGRWWLSYNGELYNYRELREGLANRWQFETQGDVEVVLAGLVTLGTDFLDQMEGMWAMALWDAHAQKLLLVRDRMGQKPLYFQTNGQLLACASELNALVPLSWFDWQEDSRSTADYLRYGYYLPGSTAFENVHELLPGHWLRWSPGSRVNQQAYWTLPDQGFSGSRSQAGESLVRAMTAGVRRRLVSDVEVGALVSGGIDSSLVLSIASNRLGRSLKTFTIGFDAPDYDERSHARTMAEQCGGEHFEQLLAPHDGLALLDTLNQHLCQPFGDSSLMPTAMVSRLAAGHVKVALSGDGGDELFGGYNHYVARSMLRWYTRLPMELQRRAVQAIDLFQREAPFGAMGLDGHAHRLADLLKRMQLESPYVAPLNYCDDDFKQLVPDLHALGHSLPKMPSETRVGDLRRMMLADCLVYLPQDILTKVDRASMAFSLEVRSPFLDRQVVEAAFALPPRWHRMGWQGKRMLRRHFFDLLPGAVWQRPKQGFAVPLNQWFKEGMKNTLKDMLKETSSPLSKQCVNRMIDAHVSGRVQYGHRLWQLYSYLRGRMEQPWRLC